VLVCPLSELALEKELNIYSVTQLAGTLFLLTMLSSGVCSWLIIMLLRRRWDPQFKNKIIVSIITLYKITIQPMIEFYFRTLQCFEVEQGLYLKPQPSMECWQGEHHNLVIYFMVPVVLIVIVLPVLFSLYYLISKRKDLNEPLVVQRVWLLVVGYRPSFFFWEYVILLRKALLILFSVFFTDPLVSALVLMLVILKYCILLLTFEPFISKQLNNLDLIQNVAIFITFSSSLFLNDSINEEMQLLILLGILAFNLTFFGYWIHLFLPEVRIIFKAIKSNTRKAFTVLSSIVRRTTEIRLSKVFDNRLSKKPSESRLSDAKLSFSSQAKGSPRRTINNLTHDE
jgi:hypothetical protein